MAALDVAVRFALYADLAAAFGVPFFALCAAGVRTALPLRGIMIATGLVGMGLSAFGLVVIAAAMAGVPIGQVDAESISAILTGMPLGSAWAARIAGLALLVLSGFLIASRPAAGGRGDECGGAATALASLAWAGHGAMDEGAVGWFHLAADIAHLVTAGAWIGALLSLLLLVARPAAGTDAGHLRATHRALDGFARIGTIVVAVIVASGLANAWLLVGPSGLGALPGTLYGQLLLAKLALFAAMLGCAAMNRYRLAPMLSARIAQSDHRSAIVALRVSLALETGCAGIVLALVAWLGTLQPIISAG
jgi:copper resistance protein D